MYSPSAYKILLIETPNNKLIKVFACWHGGYLDGDGWRLNSGTELITEDESHYFFYGYSGSIYRLRKHTQGYLTSYTSNVYTKILSQEGVSEISVQEAIDILGVKDESI